MAAQQPSPERLCPGAGPRWGALTTETVGGSPQFGVRMGPVGASGKFLRLHGFRPPRDESVDYEQDDADDQQDHRSDEHVEWLFC